jgi:hypothetical protein
LKVKWGEWFNELLTSRGLNGIKIVGMKYFLDVEIDEMGE